MKNIKQVIYDVIQNVALENSIETGHLQAHHKLVDGLGFSSLDLARIVAILEIKLEVDPFASLVPITSVRTVGDLHEAYAKCFETHKESEPEKAPQSAPARRERRSNREQQRRRRSQARRVLS